MTFQIAKLSKRLNELEINISNSESLNLAISKSPVGWHIGHTLLTINVVIDGLKKSDPNGYKSKFNFSKIFVFTTNKIPRGKAQSPRSLQPKNNLTAEDLKNHLDITKGKLAELKTLKPNNYIEHPVFGKLKLKYTIKFLEIHTNHHLHIIRDIIKANNNGLKQKRTT
jgi:hypothetical protein